MKHTDTHYYFETTRKEGKRRVTDTHQVPWEEFNKTELMALAIRDHDGTTLGHKIWDRIHVGLRRQDLIRMVCGELPENLDTNPIHRLREAIHGGLRDNWRFINYKCCNKERYRSYRCNTV